MTIKTIIFDLGGVVVPECENFILNEFAKYLGITRQKLDKMIKRSKPRATSGKVTLLHLCERVVKKTKKDITPEQALEFYVNEYKKSSSSRDKDVVELINKLKRNYFVVCLTNTEVEIANFNKEIGLFNMFHMAYISTELKTRKPKKKIYKAVLKDLGDKPNEVLFIDDNQSYIDVANIIGMNTILYTDCDQLIKELEIHSVKL